MDAVHLNSNQEQQEPGEQRKSCLQKTLKTPVSLADSYRLERILGHGGQADVYLATRLSDNQPVVIKQLNIDSVKAWKEYELFHREADVLSRLNVSGVAKFYAAIECLEDTPPCSYIVQEYIEGESLASLLKAGHRFQTTEVYDIILQMLKILKQLHMQDPPVIHRDIKPSNIMLSSNGSGGYQVTLIDFGAVANPQVQSGGSTVAGTYGYMPPEQLMGRPHPASDIYALGAVAVELFSGISPGQMQVKDFRLIFEPEVQHLPVAVVNTLRSMLEPKIEDRLSSIDSLCKQFRKYSNDVFDIDSIKPTDINKERLVNRQLREVSSICEPGNMNLWQHLSDVTPRPVPEYYVEVLNKGIAAANNDNKRSGMTVGKVGLLTAVVVFSMTIFASIGPASVPFALVLYCFILFYIIKTIASSKRSEFNSRNMDNPSIVATKTHTMLDLIENGRKTIARIVSVEYLPLGGGNAVKEIDGLHMVNRLPSFLVRYKFNPPDDVRSEDLVHEFVSHSAPEGAFAPGDPLPILYMIESRYQGDSVVSMPYPYPAEDAVSSEVVFRSDAISAKSRDNGISERSAADELIRTVSNWEV